MQERKNPSGIVYQHFHKIFVNILPQNSPNFEKFFPGWAIWFGYTTKINSIPGWAKQTSLDTKIEDLKPRLAYPASLESVFLSRKFDLNKRQKVKITSTKFLHFNTAKHKQNFV